MQLPPSAGGCPAIDPAVLPDDVRAHLIRAAGTAADAGAVLDGVYLYRPAEAVARADALRGVLPDWARLCFAVKANGFDPVLAALAPHVDGFEVASAQEAAAARAHRPDGLLLAAGPGKSTPLLAALLAARVDVVNVESVLELHRLSALAHRAGVRVDVALRVNPARVALRGALAMGGTATAFGIAEPDVPAALAVAARLPGIRVVGFHLHAVSGVLDAVAYAGYVADCLAYATRTAREHGVDLRLVDAGGGLGQRFDGGPGPDLEVLGAELAGLRPPSGVDVVLEPGRWLAATCGWYAAGVVDVKRVHGTWFAVLRGGIGHFALPVSWDLVHRFAVLPVPAWSTGLPRPQVADDVVDVVGELCTPEDTLARGHRVERLRAGDVVVFPWAGAYGWEFALPRFLGHPTAERVHLGAVQSRS